MVKVRNFDNTIVTVTPQMLVDGAFQNWQGMFALVAMAGKAQIHYQIDGNTGHPDFTVTL